MKTSVNSAYFLLKLDLLIFLLKSLLCQPIVLRKTLKIPNIVSREKLWGNRKGSSRVLFRFVF